MNKDNITEQIEFPVWVLVDDAHNEAWKDINFKLGFQLSRLNQFSKHTMPEPLKKLIKETQWPYHENKAPKSWTLVGAQNRLPAHWVFLIHQVDEFNESDLLNLLNNLQIKTVRFFKPFEPSASLKSRLSHYEIV